MITGQWQKQVLSTSPSVSTSGVYSPMPHLPLLLPSYRGVLVLRQFLYSFVLVLRYESLQSSCNSFVPMTYPFADRWHRRARLVVPG